MLESEIFNQIKSDIAKILKSAIDNEELTSKDALKLLKVDGKEFIALQFVANQLCFEKKENIVTFIINRNINFTNICYQRCKFCSFSLPADHEDAFLLSLNEIMDRVTWLGHRHHAYMSWVQVSTHRLYQPLHNKCKPCICWNVSCFAITCSIWYELLLGHWPYTRGTSQIIGSSRAYFWSHPCNWRTPAICGRVI